MMKDFQAQAAVCKDAEVAEQAAAVESVRAELHADYEQATQQLLILKKGLPEYVAFVDDVGGIVQKREEYPDNLRRFVDEMKLHIKSPEQIEAGIRQYKTLSFQDIVYKDGHQVDVNRRAAFIADTRRNLRSHETRLSGLKSLRVQAEMFLREWLPARGTPTTPVVMIPPERAENPPKVISDFQV